MVIAGDGVEPCPGARVRFRAVRGQVLDAWIVRSYPDGSFIVKLTNGKRTRIEGLQVLEVLPMSVTGGAEGEVK